MGAVVMGSDNAEGRGTVLGTYTSSGGFAIGEKAP